MKTKMKTPQAKTPIKIYPKRDENISDLEAWNKHKSNIGAQGCSLDELILKFRSFYKEIHPIIFDLIVKEIWLEQHITYNGLRRTKRIGNGLFWDIRYAQFMNMAVGISHNVLTATFYFSPVSSYFVDFFPEFLFHDPFANPEKYQYPYKNIMLDSLVFVHQMDNRLDILAEAEKRAMTYEEFRNFAHDQAMRRNDAGEDIYELACAKDNWPYIRKKKQSKFWAANNLNFDVKK